MKAELRKAAALLRAEAFAAHPLAGAALISHAPTALLRSAGKVVSSYWPFRSEIDPRPLMKRLAEDGALIALPATPAKDRPGPLRFHPWRPDDALYRSAFGVDEPHASLPAVDPDIVLVPLLAFDRQGGRLGYGAGHYDRTLESLRAKKPILAIGLAFSAQGVDKTPTDDHDQPLDGILTERGFIAVSAPRVC